MENITRPFTRPDIGVTSSAGRNGTGGEIAAWRGPRASAESTEAANDVSPFRSTECRALEVMKWRYECADVA